MEQTFEFFEGTATESSTSPRITLRRSGQLILTRTAVDMLGEDVEYVQLGFNARTKAVGIRPAPEPTRGRYLLRHQKKSPSRLVDGKRFFAHHSVSPGRACFEVENFGKGIIGFHLTENGNGAKQQKPEVEKAPRSRKARKVDAKS